MAYFLLSFQFFLFLGVIFMASVVIGISVKWEQEWPTVPLSLQVQREFSVLMFYIITYIKCHVFLTSSLASWQATAPFLQFGAVVALTLLSPFVFRGFHVATKGLWRCHLKENFTVYVFFSLLGGATVVSFKEPRGAEVTCIIL